MGKGEVLAMSALYQYPWYELSIWPVLREKVAEKKWLYTFFSIFKNLFMLLFIAIVSKFRLYLHL